MSAKIMTFRRRPRTIVITLQDQDYFRTLKEYDMKILLSQAFKTKLLEMENFQQDLSWRGDMMERVLILQTSRRLEDKQVCKLRRLLYSKIFNLDVK